MKIGILSKNYAAKRLFLNKVPNVQYKDIRFYNLYLWRNAHLWLLIYFGLLHMPTDILIPKLFYHFKAICPTQCNIYHFFNTICYSKKQLWVISIESAVPWFVEIVKCVEDPNPDFSSIKNNKKIKHALQYLSRPNCLGLIALSNCSKNIQNEILNIFPELKTSIEKKLITVQPPQDLIIKSIEEKKLQYDNEPLTFIFVGKDYFRKGGRETLQVLTNLHNKYNFNLILISDLKITETKYLITEQDKDEAIKLIKENSSWIEHHTYLANNLVLEKIKSSHIALLPTWMDTYGYSILECQACGTPVISTSLRALTEINNDKVGWLIKVPVNKLNNPILTTKEERRIFRKELLEGLETTIEYVLRNRNEIKEKAQNCILQISQNHSPESYKEKLKTIYRGNISQLINS